MTTDKHPPPPDKKHPAETPKDQAAPVGQARHAESPEETAKLEEEKTHSKVPLPGSRDYVAGQPVSDEEYARTEDEAHRLAAAGKEQQEKDAASRDQHDPNHDPVKNPDHPNARKDHPKK